MRIIVTGSRGWQDREVVRDALLEFKREAEFANDELVVVHGYCPKGADKIADQLCTELDIEKIRVPANWKRFGAGAGPKRNQQMLDEYGPIHYTLAFRAEGKSSGTDDMMARAGRADVPTYVYNEGSRVPTLANA